MEEVLLDGLWKTKRPEGVVFCFTKISAYAASRRMFEQVGAPRRGFLMVKQKGQV